MREIVLDTETTGLDPASGDRIVEIGCVELINHIPSGRTWHCYINPERDMPQAAYEVHKLSSEFLADKPLFAQVAEDFLDFIKDARLIIHNAGFDAGFLNAELARAGQAGLVPDKVVDTLALARRKHPGASNSLDALCKRYQIDNSNRTTHGALIDAELLAKVYIELIGGHQARLELPSGASATAAAVAGAQIALERPCPLPERLSEAERRAHRLFVETLVRRAIWLDYLDGNRSQA